MQSVQYFILGVTTLTDARYFSALGARYLHFDLNPKSPYALDQSAYEAIVEWVEGSDIICSFDHLFDEESIRDLIDSENLAGIMSIYPDMLDYVHRIRPELKLFQKVQSDEAGDDTLPLTGIISEKTNHSRHDLFQLFDDPAKAETAVKSGATKIALHPGSEDEVGIKDFEAYDRLLYQEFD